MSTREHALYLFDVDGTLTKSRQVISEHFKKFLLDEVMPRVCVGLVSGSDYSKIVEQMSDEQTAARFDYMFCENGLMHYRQGVLRTSESILTHMGEQTLQRVINFALGYMAKLELPVKRGNFIEYRTSMINICPVGRSCNQAERDQFVQYDIQHKIRETFVAALRKEFHDMGLMFALGGQISIDVFPMGWDKTFCLKHVSDANFKEIHFFGDKTDAGGNDHEIFHDARTIGHRVTSPDDTLEQLKMCLKIV